MSDIGFYHLTRLTAVQALPPLLGRTLKIGARAVIFCTADSLVAELDAALWLSTDPDWLPHGTALTGHAELQPIWITNMDEAPNGARYVFLPDGASPASFAKYDRAFTLFDGNDAAATQAARDMWARLKADGHSLTYWQQGTKGWEKKAGT